MVAENESESESESESEVDEADQLPNAGAQLSAQI